MFLISPQPETFNSIFIMNEWDWFGYSATLLIGVLFLLAAGLILLIKRRNRQQAVKWIIMVAVVCWSLLFVNSFYNSWYDVADNLKLHGLTMEQKRLRRVYSFERSQGLGYTYYDVLSFLPQAETVIPKNAGLLCLIPYVLNPYFYYNLYPDYPAVTQLKNVDYVLFYAPLDDYIFTDQHLYQVDQNQTRHDLGRYEIIKMFDDAKIIFKKIKITN
jgi:hypothetical protein